MGKVSPQARESLSRSKASGGVEAAVTTGMDKERLSTVITAAHGDMEAAIP